MTASHASVVRFQMTPSRTIPALLTRMSSATPLVDRPFDHCFGVVFIGHVAIVRNGRAATCCDQPDCGVCVLARTLSGDRAS